MEELRDLNSFLIAQVIFISETKIHSSNSNDLFNFEGYRLVRKKHKKGGCGILVYITLSLTSKKIKLPREYKTIEALVIKIMLPVGNQ